MMILFLTKMVMTLTKKKNRKATVMIVMIRMIKKVVTFKRQDSNQCYQGLAIFRAGQDIG